MKKAILILGAILFAILLITLFIPSNHEYSKDDCIELGLCVEGLELKDNGKPFIMTQEYCINNNYVWYEDNKVCNVRKFNN